MVIIAVVRTQSLINYYRNLSRPRLLLAFFVVHVFLDPLTTQFAELNPASIEANKIAHYMLSISPFFAFFVKLVAITVAVMVFDYLYKDIDNRKFRIMEVAVIGFLILVGSLVSLINILVGLGAWL